MGQLDAQLEGLGIGLEQRGEKSAAHCIRMTLAKIARLRAENERLKAILKECSDDLECMIEYYYRDTLDYPSQRLKYERDMEPVEKARAALADDGKE